MAGVRDIIFSYVFMVNKCEIITQCLEVCYEYNLPFDKVYRLIEQVRDCIDGTIIDCQKYLKNKEHDEVSAILNKCISYQDEFVKSPSKHVWLNSFIKTTNDGMTTLIQKDNHGINRK